MFILRGVLTGLCLLAVSLPLSALHPNHPLGRAPERSYQAGISQIDQIDLYSGTLMLQIPIGPFQLNYSSNVWRYETDPTTLPATITAQPDRENNAGMGWHLGWGEVYHWDHWYNPTSGTDAKWMYVGEDGGRHFFYSQLHKGEDDGDPNVYYSRDGSYLRLTQDPGRCWVQIEERNGVTRRFTNGNGQCGTGTAYRLQKVWSRFGSVSDPHLTVSYSADFNTWTAVDRYGRTHKVYLQPASWINRVITRVELYAGTSQAANYYFSHEEGPIARSCKDTDSSTPLNITVPLLTSITLPDGSTYEMKEGSQRLYHTTCSGGIADVSGSLRKILLPTGGQIEWEYQEYVFPPGPNWSAFNTNAGVQNRILRSRSGAEVGRWRYRSTSKVVAGQDPEMQVEVEYPTGDCSKHFFNARYWQNPAQGRGWEHGLPFVYSESSGGKYLSRQTWTASTSGGACTGTKLRSTYLRYRHDPTPGSGTAPAADWYNTNRQAEASRTVFHDDGDRWVDSEQSEFDGLGNFRRIETTGNLWAGSTSMERRVVYTDYSRVSGVFPGTYQPIPVSEPWVLDIHDSVEVTDDDALGGSQSRVETVFDRGTGTPLCRRTLASGTTRSANDVVVTFENNSVGELTDMRSYGGDLQPLSLSGPECGTLPSQPEYWMTYTHSSGRRATARGRTPSGGYAPFYSEDRDIDPETGRVLRSRDASGFETEMTYDGLGRVVTLTPEEGAVQTFQYNLAQGSAWASTVRSWNAPGSGILLAQSFTNFDDFGRLRRERHRLPGAASWAEREHHYNARGWPTSISEWGDLAKTTEYLHYDPFGRATIIRPPDGVGRDVLLSFQGNRVMTRQTKVAQAGGETYVSSTMERDAYGRLRTVREPAGPGGQQVTTTYRYDVGGRLARSLSGSGPQQQRNLSYDNRGVMLTEAHPEKGTFGDGTVTRTYDSRGLVRRVTDGPNDLVYARDDFGRLLQVLDANQGLRLVEEYYWDGAPGRGLGRLWSSVRHNRLDLPGPPSLEEDHPVVETYVYQGLAGAVSARSTYVTLQGDTRRFDQSYSYTPLGALSTISYPECAGSTCLSQTGSGRTVSYQYSRGWLSAVPGWVDSMTYDPGATLASVTHSNQVVDHLTPHAFHRSRPGRIHTTGASQNFDSGAFAYDGAGNITAIGASTFAYDGVGRLVESDFLGYQQDFSYDAFGNLIDVDTMPPSGTWVDPAISVDSSTNRLQDGTYDGAGNLVAYQGETYHYSEANRLESNDRLGAYLYNADGERVAQVAAQRTATKTVHFTLRDLQHRILSRFRQHGDKWSRLEDYVYAGDRLVARATANGGARHFHLDHLGSPRLITNESGGTVLVQDFLPYGQEIPRLSLESNLLKFTGHERDGGSGFDYMHARHYTSEVGRFLSVDPLRGALEAPQSLNRYAYAGGNPLRYVDPDGRRNQQAYEQRRQACIANPQCDVETWEVLYQVAEDTWEIPVISYGIINVLRELFGGAVGTIVDIFEEVLERNEEFNERDEFYNGDDDDASPEDGAQGDSDADGDDAEAPGDEAGGESSDGEAPADSFDDETTVTGRDPERRPSWLPPALSPEEADRRAVAFHRGSVGYHNLLNPSLNLGYAF